MRLRKLALRGRRQRGSGKLVLRAPTVNGAPGASRFADDGTPLFKFLFRHPAGWSRTIYAASRQLAAEAAARLDGKPSPEQVTFREVSSSFLEHRRTSGRCSPATVNHYLSLLDKHILDSIGSRKIGSLGPADVTAVLNRSSLGPVAHNTLSTLLGSIFAFALEHEYISRSPVRRSLHRRSTKEVRRRRHAALGEAMPTFEQVNDFISAALDFKDDTSAGIALAVSMLTGLRRDELQHARREDVSLTPGLSDLLVATDFECACRACQADGGRHRTKNRNARYVPLTKLAERIVRQHLHHLEADSVPGPWLFPVLRHKLRARNGAGSQMDREDLRQAMQEIAKAAGVDLPARVSVHFCRHVALSRWEAAGLTQSQRDLASGHTAPGVRAVYSHGDRVSLFKVWREKLVL